VYGSIKRWAAWILLGLVCLVIFASLLPGGSVHLGTWLSLSWNHKPCDETVLTDLLKAIGTYILGGATVSMIGNTVQNFHNQKYGSDTPTPTQ
jgi:hypothetical protein